MLGSVASTPVDWVIPYPPSTSSTALGEEIETCVRELNTSFSFRQASALTFKDKKFEDYLDQLNWFRGLVPRTEVILDAGCSHGRQTFALTWGLDAVEALGVDISQKSIDFARYHLIGGLSRLARWVPKFLNMTVPPGAPEDLARDIRQLCEWWECQVPVSIKTCVKGDAAPEFVQGDILDRTQIPWPDGHCDLVYCCNVLDYLVNEDRDWCAAIRNLAALTKPATGRVVVVGATKRDSAQDKHSRRFMPHDDFRPCFEQAGLELIAVEEMASLGYIDSPTTIPRGYVYSKPDRPE